MDKFDIQKVKEGCDIVEVLRWCAGVEPNRQHKIRCLNPAHDDANPSMYVHLRTNNVKCYSCGSNYNPIDVAMITQGWTFPEACKNLAEHFGIVCPSITPNAQGVHVVCNTPPPKQVEQLKPNYIPSQWVEIQSRQPNKFLQQLEMVFPFPPKDVERVANMYRIGGTAQGFTIFWEIDQNGNVCYGDIIDYPFEASTPIDALPLKRNKHPKEQYGKAWAYNVHGKLNIPYISCDGSRCMFGTHLLAMDEYKTKPIGIVEGQKTAVLASLIIPNILWLATCGANNFIPSHLQCLRGRKVCAYPDMDASDKWQAVTAQMQAQGMDITINTSLLPKCTTAEQKTNKDDIGDLIWNALRSRPKGIFQQERITKEDIFKAMQASNPTITLLCEKFGLSLA